MTPFVQNVTDILSFVIVVSDIGAVALLILLLTPIKYTPRGRKIAAFFGDNAVLFAFIITATSVASSLFYSQIAQFQPCLLCWWQRVFMYPQAIILLVAFIANDDRVRKYCITLSTLGALIAVYHTYLQFGGSELIPCTANGASCQQVYFLEYGYVTIPTMALTGFLLVILLLLFKKKES